MKPNLRDAVVIRKCDNLNKENFWDSALEICPVAAKLFRDWIDQYKGRKISSVMRGIYSFDWNGLFGNNYAGGFLIEFDHLPLEMQVGVIYKFFHELGEQWAHGAMNWCDPEAQILAICRLFEDCEEALAEAAEEKHMWDMERDFKNS